MAARWIKQYSKARRGYDHAERRRLAAGSAEALLGAEKILAATHANILKRGLAALGAADMRPAEGRISTATGAEVLLDNSYLSALVPKFILLRVKPLEELQAGSPQLVTIAQLVACRGPGGFQRGACVAWRPRGRGK